MRIGLALSGGGFRATLYHLGVARFLRDADLLSRVTHITSVSGGSVLAAHLVLNWERYCGSPDQFDGAAQEILQFVSLDVRNRIVRRYPWLILAGLWGRLVPRGNTRLLTRTGLLERYYERYLFGDVCLHQLPPTPEIHILSTNVSEGGLSSFTRAGLLLHRRLRDGSLDVEPHRAGLAKVATAVAASSAFPAFFPPLELRAVDIGASEGEFPTQYFTDGGIFDNLGVRMFDYLSGPSRTQESDEAQFVDVVLASDVGRVFAVYGPDRTPGFLSTALRSSDILMNRVWQLERLHFAHDRQYVFAASSDVVPPEADATALHPEIQVQVSRIRTDMDRFREIEVGGLIRHGYCVARQACRALPTDLSERVIEAPPWDPTEPSEEIAHDANAASAGSVFNNVAKAAHGLQDATRRRLWSSLLDLGDWVTWFYIPLIVLLLGALPLFAYRKYRHARLDASLSRAVVEMREDFRKMLELLEFGPPEEFPSMQVEDTDALRPRLAEEGLDIISDTRITDLREWLAGSHRGPRRVFVYRHVMVRKLTESKGIPGLRLQSLWDSPDLSVHCENTQLRPVVRRCNQSAAGEAGGPFAWEVMLDFSSVPVGETVDVVVSVMQSAVPDDRRLAENEWWRFEVDAQPEVATSWVLLPEHQSRTSFSVVRSRNDEREVIELVKPTHQTRMQGGAVMSWSVVHPEPGYTYSSRWASE
jgi:predicted acylesterase/phospholipase RssA